MAILNSVRNLHRAEEFLKRHQTIHCFLDNDESGRRAFSAVEKLGIETIDQSPFYRNHPHIHLIMNRIDFNGKRISDQNEKIRNVKICKELTLKHGLYVSSGKENVK